MVEPMGAMILVEKIEEDEVRESGLVVIRQYEGLWHKARVIAVGPGELNKKTRKREKMDIEPGDTVIMRTHGGHDVTIDGQDLILVNGEQSAEVFAKVVENVPA